MKEKTLIGARSTVVSTANTLLGHNQKDNGYIGLILIGDNLEAKKNNEIRLGKTLFGKPIPRYFKDMLSIYSDELVWILKSIIIEINERNS